MTGLVQVVSASAGTGKTYRLAKEMAEAVIDGRARPEAIVAVTYTNKAAAELARRLRKRLLSVGRVSEAARIRDGYLGTVHAICQRLIRELAFDAALSPYLTPAPEELGAGLYRASVDRALGAAVGQLDLAARPLSLDTRKETFAVPGRGAASSWRTLLKRAVRLAVENRMDGPALGASVTQSWDEVRTLLDALDDGATGLDGAVAAAVVRLEEIVVRKIAEDALRGKVVKADADRLSQVRTWQRTLRDEGRLRWRDIAVLTKRGSAWGTKAYDDAFAPLQHWLALQLGHPQLHTDLRSVLDAVIGAAQQVADAFVAVKAAEGVLDFEDMLAFAADLLSQDAVRQRLAGRFDLVLVDEFQDTSPVQLTAILGLCRLAPRAVWVGDRKQAIFGFQGSDPLLMADAARAVTGGAPLDVLGENFRSRPPLVSFTSAVFSWALAVDGVPAAEVAVQPATVESPALVDVPALHLWRLVTPLLADEPLDDNRAVARGVAELLATSLLVRERLDDPKQVAPTRAVRAGDVAVLARRNQDCREIAAHLRTLGLDTRVQLDGLGKEPVAWLLRAGLALLVDPDDRLASAELSWLCGGYADGEGAWLSARIAEAAGETEVVRHPSVDALRVHATRAWALSPVEAVDVVLGATDAATLALGWPDGERALANLEALRGVARTYEDLCAARRVAATVAGLVAHLGALPPETVQGVASGDDAVNVLTWHRAKGLEWPVVVLTSLGQELREDPFEVRVRPAEVFDAVHPLANRTLRWWPNPYELQSRGMVYTDRALASPAFMRIAAEQQAEERRLVYVAFTRARDHLVLAAATDKKGAVKVGVIERLRDAVGAQALTLPWWGADGALPVVEVSGSTLTWSCTARPVVDGPFEAALSTGQRRWFTGAAPVSRRPLWLAPSSAGPLDVPDAGHAADVVPLGDRLPVSLPDADWCALGLALHGFLATDAGGAAPERAEHAVGYLMEHGLSGRVDPQVFLRASDALATWIRGRGITATVLREWPVVHRRADGRIVRGEIDLLLRHPDGGWIVVDHKSFPGDAAARDARVVEHAPQLKLYADAVEAATGEPVRERWLHLPVRGELVRVVD